MAQQKWTVSWTPPKQKLNSWESSGIGRAVFNCKSKKRITTLATHAGLQISIRFGVWEAFHRYKSRSQMSGTFFELAEMQKEESAGAIGCFPHGMASFNAIQTSAFTPAYGEWPMPKQEDVKILQLKNKKRCY